MKEKKPPRPSLNILVLENFILVDNIYPHDMKSVSQQYRKFYAETSPSKNEVLDVGRKWFERRLNHIVQGSHPIFTAHQSPRHLPDSWSSSKFNIAFFETL